ncbi:MAG: hypothetical protein R2731_09415 [Nocardioides sp.]
MADAPPTQSARPTGTAPQPRRRGLEPARRALLYASVMVALGSFLPWIYTHLGTISGTRGAGLWTFYASMLGFAGVFLPLRRVAAVQALVMAAVGVVLPLWQVVHLVDLVGFAGWLPGPGLVMVFGGGVYAATAGRRLLAESA